MHAQTERAVHVERWPEASVAMGARRAVLCISPFVTLPVDVALQTCRQHTVAQQYVTLGPPLCQCNCQQALDSRCRKVAPTAGRYQDFFPSWGTHASNDVNRFLSDDVRPLGLPTTKPVLLDQSARDGAFF